MLVGYFLHRCVRVLDIEIQPSTLTLDCGGDGGGGGGGVMC